MTIDTEELHRRSVWKSNFQRIRPLRVIVIIFFQFLLVLLDAVRKVRGQHFLLEVSFAIRISRDGVKSSTWKVVGVCSRIQVPALSAVMFFTAASLSRNAMSSPCE